MPSLSKKSKILSPAQTFHLHSRFAYGTWICNRHLNCKAQYTVVMCTMKQNKAKLEFREQWRDVCFGETVREGLSVKVTSGGRTEWNENIEGNIFPMKVIATAKLWRLEHVFHVWGSMQTVNSSYATGVEWERKCLHTLQYIDFKY